MLLQEWERLDTGGDGLILFDTFCSWAAQWQLVDDTGRRGTGSFMGFSRKLPTLDPVYLKGGSVHRQVSPILLLLCGPVAERVGADRLLQIGRAVGADRPLCR